MAHPEHSDGYARTLVRDGERTLIWSECDYCGLVIVGSVPDLTEDENRHREKCGLTKSRGAGRNIGDSLAAKRLDGLRDASAQANRRQRNKRSIDSDGRPRSG